MFFLCLFLDILRRITAIKKTEYKIIFAFAELFVVDRGKEEISRKGYHGVNDQSECLSHGVTCGHP